MEPCLWLQVIVQRPVVRCLRPCRRFTGNVLSGWRDEEHQWRFVSIRSSRMCRRTVWNWSKQLRSHGVYSSSNVLLERINSPELQDGKSFKLIASRASSEIAYVVIKGH